MESEVRRYHVVEAVGRGGFGTVYRARLLGPSGFSKQVALKVLNPDAPESIGVAERLRDEARLLGMLRHRAIVQVDGLHLLGGRWTVVMEFVEGADLKQVLVSQGPLPAGVVLEIVQEVANALHYAWELSQDLSVSALRADAAGSRPSLRLMHRDIKPGNIQLTASGEIKVLDFGVARADFADRESQTQSVYFGSLNYMAPERLDGIDDHKGDVYALGAVAFELLTGQPFGRTSANRERHDQRLREALARLWELHPDEELYRLVAECLLYDPEARPSARELERACRQLRAGLPGPYLSEWAEQAVPAILARREAIPDELSGATLVEASSIAGGVTSGHAPRPAPRSRATGARRGLSLAVGAGAALLVLVGGGLWFGARLREPSAVAPRRPVLLEQGLLDAEPASSDPSGPAAQAGPASGAGPADLVGTPSDGAPSTAPAPSPPSPGPPVEPVASGGTTAPSRRDDAPPTGPSSRGARTVEEPPAPPVEEASGTVRVVSGAAGVRVRLLGQGQSYPPGKVPAGSYTLEARFDDGTVDQSVRLRVEEGRTVQLSCVAALHRCLEI